MPTTIDTPLAFDDYVVTGPGIYDMPEDVYHADPVPGGSLSKSGAKLLLEPSCPAKYKYEKDHGRPPKREFDLGTAAHTLVLGSGPELVEIGFDNWRTDKANDQAAAARERGAVPLLSKDMATVKAMAAALREHPMAATLLTRWGRSEQSAFWRDRPTGVIRRCRFDVLPHERDGRMVIPDYKSCAAADKESISKAVEKFKYHMQAAWYLDGARALDLAGEDAAFVFVFQERTAPYLVNVVQLDVAALLIGAALNRRAVNLYAQCTASGRWPGYGEDIEEVTLPVWAERKGWEEEL